MARKGTRESSDARELRLFFKQTSDRRFASWCSRADGKSPVIAFLRARNSDGNGETGGEKEKEEE